jgi:hypothetical protein
VSIKKNIIHHLVPSNINSAVKTASLNKDGYCGSQIMPLIICTFYARLAKRDTALARKLTSVMEPDAVVFTVNCIAYCAEGAIRFGH